MTVDKTGILTRFTTILLVGLCLIGASVHAQDNVGIGTANPNPSALLDLESTTKGFLAPRMTTAQRDAIILPANGLMIFNLSTDMYQYNFGTPLVPAWISFLSIDISGGTTSKNFWSLSGNDSVNVAQHFIGTRNAQPLIFKTDNTLRMTIATNGEVTTESGIVVRSGGLNLLGTSSPLLMDGNSGGVGQLLVSGGPGSTPQWTPDLVLNAGGLIINTRTTINQPFIVADSATFNILPKMPLQYGHMLVGNQQDIAAPMAPGINGALLQIVAGTPTWVTPDAAAYWSRSGNSGIGATDYLGTTDANDLRFATNGQLRMTISGANGKISVNDLAGVPLNAPLAPTDGLVLADASGQLVKRSISSLLALPRNNLFVGDENNVASPFAPGPDSSFLAIFNGQPTWFDLSQVLREDPWIQGGNTAPSSPILGNMSATGMRDLDIRAGGQSVFYLNGTTPQVDVMVPLNLSGATTPLLADGIAGTTGNPFVSSGAGQTPRWTTGMTIGDLSVEINAPALTINSAQTTFVGEAAFTDSATFSILPRLPLTYGYMLIGNSTNVATPVAPGINGAILQIQNGNPTWIAQEFASYWSLSGNSGVGATDFLGTRDANDLRFGTNNQLRMTINSANGGVNITSLAGAGLSGVPPVGEGVVVVDASGSLAKREISSLLQLPLNHIYVGNAQNMATPYAPGADSTFLGIVAGQPQWVSLASLLGTSSWSVGGNPSPSSAILGNMAATGMRDLDIRAGGSTALFLNGTTPVVDVRVPLNLSGTITPFTMNGQPGAIGNPLVSAGAGATPTWSTGLSISNTNVTINADAFAVNSQLSTFNNNVSFADSVKFSLLPEFPLQNGYTLVGNTSNIATPLAPGINGSIFQIVGGSPAWITPSTAAFWSLTGNSGTGATDFLGTTDANDLRIATNNQLRLVVASGNGSVTVTNLSTAPIYSAIGPMDGIVVADASGMLVKRDRQALLEMLGIYGGRYVNTTGTELFSVVVTLPSGATLDPNASITLTPEASSSVSVTPFVVNGSRTSTTFTVNFPGGLNPAEAINWLVRNP
ncbi:MAG: hypothetical protein SGJ05_06485 [bacterium]|nr:hypothetical protein [bacterium]